MPYGDVTDRIELRKRLNCSSFEWFLRNVYPDLLTPDQKKQLNIEAKNVHKVNQAWPHKRAKIVSKFMLQLDETNLCLEIESEILYKGSKLLMVECDRTQRKQIWKQSDIKDIRMGPKACLNAMQAKNQVQVAKCHEMGGTQHWEYPPTVMLMFATLINLLKHSPFSTSLRLSFSIQHLDFVWQ